MGGSSTGFLPRAAATRGWPGLRLSSTVTGSGRPFLQLLLSGIQVFLAAGTPPFHLMGLSLGHLSILTMQQPASPRAGAAHSSVPCF